MKNVDVFDIGYGRTRSTVWALTIAMDTKQFKAITISLIRRLQLIKRLQLIRRLQFRMLLDAIRFLIATLIKPKKFFKKSNELNYEYKPFHVKCFSTQRNEDFQILLSSVQQSDVLYQYSGK